MSDYKEIIKALPAKERKALDVIYSGRMTSDFAAAELLIKKGLVVSTPLERQGVAVREYDFALYAAHMAWSELCSEEVEGDRDDD